MADILAPHDGRGHPPINIDDIESPLGRRSAHSSSHKNGNENGNGNGHGHGTQPQPQPHKVAYEDPDADVSLQSNEGRIFKVESYVLKTHSTYFRAMFKPAVPKYPIPIDASTKILKGLLDIMHMRPVPSGMVWAYKDKLLALADKLGTPSVAERAVFSMHDSVQKDPWGVFCLASQRGNLSLAKAALKCLADIPDAGDGKGGGAKAKIEKLTPALAAGVTLPYLLGLFNAALGANGHFHTSSNGGEECVSEDGHGGAGAVGWKAIADRFTPVVG